MKMYMDEKGLTAEELVPEILRQFAVAGGEIPDGGTQPPLENPEGLLASLDQWSRQYPDAVTGLTHKVIGNGEAMTLPLAPLLVDIVESAIALGSLTNDSIDEFLRRRTPRVVIGPNDTTKWAVLTAITDRDALIHEVLGESAPRAHRRAEPPSIGMHLAEGHRAEDLREAFGLTLRQVLDVNEQPTPKSLETVIRPLIASVRSSSRELADGLEWLLRNQPQALLEMPTTVAALDALQGNLEPRPALRLRFAHLLELEGLGYCVLVMWDASVRLARRERSALAGHLRHLADTAVAPWNRYPDLKRRREAFAVWVRHLRDDRVDAQRLADHLRAQHADDYKNERRSKTIARIYRISTELNDARLPQGVMKELRDYKSAQT